MKRITTLLLFVLSFAMIKAQAPQTNLLTFDQAKSRLEKSIEDSKNEKKSIKPATWMKLADAYAVAAEVNHQSINAGSPQVQINLLMGSPLSKEQKEFKGSLFNVSVYKYIDLYFDEAAELAFWMEKETILENGLDEAIKAYDKALELDVKGKLGKKVTQELIGLTISYRKVGANYFQTEKFAEAAHSFKMYLALNERPEINVVDTSMYYYTGVSFYRAGNMQEALVYYKKAIDLGFIENGALYIELHNIYNEIGDKELAVKALEEGFQSSPDNSAIMGLLINAYLAEGKDPQDILKLLSAAKIADPENASLYVVEGNLYEKLGEQEKAVVAYNAAIERDPMSLYAYYSLGSMHINKANELIKQANALPISKQKEYDKLIEGANAQFRESLPYLKKAHEVAPDDKDVAEILKTIYFKFRMESDEMMKGWEEMKAILEQ